MGVRNHLVEGVSGTGKTSVGRELRRRGYHVVHGDTELAYQGDPTTGVPTGGSTHEHHVWPEDRVRELVADHRWPVTFFCGGSRNVGSFIDAFDGVFVLQVDVGTLQRRLAARGADEFGGTREQRELVLRLHATGEDTPTGGVPIDATAPVDEVVDEILRRSGETPGHADATARPRVDPGPPLTSGVTPRR